MLQLTSLELQYPLCMTVDMNLLITDLAPSDYFLFPNIKKRYKPEYDVISAVEDFFENQEETFTPLESKYCSTNEKSA